MEKVLIRPAKKDDLPQILEILNHEILNGTSVYDYEIKSLAFINNWFDEKLTHQFPLLVAVLNNEIMGYATYGLFRPREGYKFSIEHSVYLSKSSQGKGLGSLLMMELIDIAVAQNFHRMLAVVDAANEGSCDFHKKLGFIEIGRMNEVGYKFDRWLDVVILQLNLDSLQRN